MKFPILHPIWRAYRLKKKEQRIRSERKREFQKYKYAHIMNNGIHSVNIVNFINKYFDNSEHVFIFPVLKEKVRQELLNFKNVYNVNLYDVPWIHFDKVVIHGLFNKGVTKFLYKNKHCLKNTYWFIWGGDLYCKDDDVSKWVKKNFAGILTSFDYEVYKERFGEKKCYDVTYPHDMSSEMITKPKVKKDVIDILVNNSGDETTLEMLDILAKFKNENINIRTILSYKSANQSDVRLEIMDKGYTIFGNKFKPEIHFMSRENYANFLANIDIYISNQNRQQGNGNATFICSLGGKIFTKSDTSVYKKYNSIGIKYFDTYSIPSLSFQDFVHYDHRTKLDTIEKLTLRMDDENKKCQWRDFFNF